MSILSSIFTYVWPGYNFDFSFSYLITLLLFFVGAFFIVLCLRNYFKVKSFKQIWIYLVLCCLILGAIITTGDLEKIFSKLTLFVFLGALFISYLIQRFRKTVGTLTVLLIISLVILLFLFIRSFTAFTGQTKLATIKVLESKNSKMALYLIPENTKAIDLPTTIPLKGTRFGLIVYQVIFSDMAVFVGAKTRYSWIGMTAFDSGFKQTDLKPFNDFFQKKKIFELMEKKEVKLPFIKSIQAEIPNKIALQGSTYDVYIENDGGITIKTRKID